MPATYDFSLARILFGELPWHSVVELLLRAIVIFAFGVIAARALGKHGASQLPPIERVLLGAIGVIVGYGVVALHVPLIHIVLALTTMVLLNFGLARLTRGSRDVLLALRAQTRRIAFSGRLDADTLRAEGFSSGAVFSALREAGIENLGQVRAAFLEPSGRISVLRYQVGAERIGLPLAPFDDGASLRSRLHRALIDAPHACCGCGQVIEFTAGAIFTSCSGCGGRRWLPLQPGRPANAGMPDPQVAERRPRRAARRHRELAETLVGSAD